MNLLRYSQEYGILYSVVKTEVCMINKFKFVFLSIFGFIFFLMPFSINGESKIAISHIVSYVTNNYMDIFMVFTIILAWIVLILSIVFIFYTSKSEFLNTTFKASPLNVILRVLGSFLYLMVVNGWFANSSIAGLILDENTGGLMAGPGGLLTTLYITFFVGIIA